MSLSLGFTRRLAGQISTSANTGLIGKSSAQGAANGRLNVAEIQVMGRAAPIVKMRMQNQVFANSYGSAIIRMLCYYRTNRFYL